MLKKAIIIILVLISLDIFTPFHIEADKSNFATRVVLFHASKKDGK